CHAWADLWRNPIGKGGATTRAAQRLPCGTAPTMDVTFFLPPSLRQGFIASFRNAQATRRRNMLHRWFLALSLALTASASGVAGPRPAQAEDVPQIAYESVPNVLKMPPDMHIGEAAGVAVNSKGHIFVYSRNGSGTGPAYGNAASQLFEFTSDGHF